MSDLSTAVETVGGSRMDADGLGPGPWAAVPAHRALLFESVPEQVDALAPTLERALARDESIALRLGRPVLDALRARVGDGLAHHGRVEVQEPEDHFGHPARILSELVDLVHQLTASGRPATLIGEPLFDDPRMDHRTWAQVESALNVTLAGRPVTAVCCYGPTVPPGLLDDIRRAHPELEVGGERRPSSGYLEPARYLALRQAPLPAVPGGAHQVDLRGAGDLRGVRRAAAATARAAGLHPDRIEDFALAVTELATNSVEHGAAPHSLRLWVDTDEVGAEVANAGPFTNALRGLLPPALTQVRGRGLHLTRRLCDRMDLWVDAVGVRVQARMLRR